ncbi:MAG: hypothetical protein WCL00_14220, partial [Bacteroidota bacterium]
YFAVSAFVWEGSTELNLKGAFGNSTDLLLVPPNSSGYSANALKPLMHLFNCHGSINDANYYGQQGDNYPVALKASDLSGKVSFGTVVAAECCYGAQLFKPTTVKPKSLSVANTYFQNNGIAFAGSSTIAYGETATLSNADLMTMYFFKSILNGASAGRAMLEARQKFLTATGPHFDPFELKTLAQYYLLGDPSITPVLATAPPPKNMIQANTVENRRLNLYSKGINLKQTSVPCRKVVSKEMPIASKDLKQLLKQVEFTGKETQNLYALGSAKKSSNAKSFPSMGPDIRYRAFTKPHKGPAPTGYQVLVVKETETQVLGWKIYCSK